MRGRGARGCEGVQRRARERKGGKRDCKVACTCLTLRPSVSVFLLLFLFFVLRRSCKSFPESAAGTATTRYVVYTSWRRAARVLRTMVCCKCACTSRVFRTDMTEWLVLDAEKRPDGIGRAAAGAAAAAAAAAAATRSRRCYCTLDVVQDQRVPAKRWRLQVGVHPQRPTYAEHTP